MKFVKFSFLVLSVLLITSCASKKDLIYLQGTSQAKELVSYEPVLQPDDVLFIVVASENAEVAAPYNLRAITLQSDSEEQLNQQRQQSYLID